MGMLDMILTGKSRMEAWEGMEETFKEMIERIEKEKDVKKRISLEKNARKRLGKFFKNLYKEGVEVELDKEDGKGIIICEKDFERIELKRIYREYVIRTLKEINKEINRRLKNEQNWL